MTRGASHLLTIGLLAGLAVVLVSLSWREPPAPIPHKALPGPGKVEQRLEPISPLPLPAEPERPDVVALGERLFHDPRLSRDGSVACSSCHSLLTGGADSRPRSRGVGGAVGKRNAPTVFNAVYNTVQFWDGRAASLEAQVEGPLHDPLEMASTWDLAIERLRQDRELRAGFETAYADGLTAANLVDALAAYQRTLVTPNAPFDRYLRGDLSAIDERARDGYSRFKSFGCASCHQGVNVGGNMLQRFGVMGDYYADRGDPGAADLGRYLITGREEDRYVFKVPSLRNVALTAPYFHDGSVGRLEEAVEIMGRYQLGRELSEDDIDAIVAFLNTLTGEQPVNSTASGAPE